MTVTQYRLSWDTYESNISNGFAHFQQNEEFVDMTLAADGHLVKVHRNIIALASPYIKHMLQSVACQHPVIFLHNVTHNILHYLLEYIYTGEVQVPDNMIHSLIEAAKALSIKGVESIIPTEIPQQNVPLGYASSSESERTHSKEQTEPTQVTQPTGQQPNSNFAAHITINPNDYNLEVHPLVKNYIDNTPLDSNGFDYETLDDSVRAVSNHKDLVNDIQSMPIILSENDNTNMEMSQIGLDLDNKKHQHPNHSKDITIVQEPYDDSSSPAQNLPNVDLTAFATPISNSLPDTDLEHLVKTELKPQYTISNRGALQLALNRYLYYCHHQAYGGRKRRWRCVDYRKLHCPALIDMEGETIFSRVGIHCHPYHDFKIHQKLKKELLFTSATEAEDVRVRKTKDIYATVPGEQEG